MIASYVRPTSAGSIDRYGTSQTLPVGALVRVAALLDRVLVGAGERGVDEVADVRVARVYRQLVALLDDVADAVDADRSRFGTTPCVSRFSAIVTRSTLPVRSPFPNSDPSTRSPPAISASSAVATAVPRSLCGWAR